MKGQYNIIMITIDALRRDCLGCYGNPYGTSPNIDRLAERSLLLENVYSTGFGTDPIHTSLLTGLLPWSHGIFHHGPWVTKEEVQRFLSIKDQFLPSILKAEGYQTLAVDFLGRWHRTGFDYYSGALGGGVLRRVVKTQRHRILQAVTQTRRLQRLFPYTILKLPLGRMAVYDSAEEVVSHAKARFSSITKPFFFFLHFWDTHTPYDPPAKYCRRFKSVSTEHNQSIDVLLSNVRQASFKTYLTRCAYGANYTDEILRRYLGSIRYVDDQIGSLLSYLESSGLLDDTVIIIAADHGEHLGEHGTYFVHHTMFNEILRVPLIIRLPDEKHGSVEAPCQLIDIVPTILDLLNIQSGFQSDGLSLMPLIRGQTSQQYEARSIILGQPEFEGAARIRSAIIKGKYKYILSPEESQECQRCGFVHHQGEELYDLEADPGETSNLVGKEQRKAEELRTELLRFLESSKHKIEEMRPIFIRKIRR